LKEYGKVETEQKSGHQILGEGLESILNADAFREAMDRIANNAYDKVFAAHAAGGLTWKRTGRELQDFVTEITVQNGRGEPVTITVTLFTSYLEHSGRSAYLMLGGKTEAPCRNSADPRVKSLIEQLTGAPLNA
jgi:hypothetical protein